MRGLLWSYYFYKMLVDGVKFTTPFIIIYLLRYISMGQVLLLTALQFLVMSLLEIPSGAFADEVGHREALMVSVIFGAAGSFAFLFGSGLLHFALAYIFMGVSSVMISGSHEPLLYGVLERKKRTEDATKIFGKTEYYASRVSDLSFLVASGVAALSLRGVFFLELLKWPFILLLVYKMPRNRRKFKKNFKPYFIKTRTAFKFLLERKDFSFIIIIASVVYSVFLITSQYHQPLMSAAGINIAFFGLVYVVFNQARGFSTRLAYLFKSRMTPARLVLISLIVKGAILILLGVFTHPFLVVVLLVSKIGVEGFRKPFYTAYITMIAPKDSRSTIMSFGSFIHSLSFVFLSVAFKFLTDWFSVYLAIFMSGAFLLFLVPLVRIESLVLKSQTDSAKKS